MKHKKKRVTKKTVSVEVANTPIWKEDVVIFAVLLFPSILLLCSLLYIMTEFVLR